MLPSVYITGDSINARDSVGAIPVRDWRSHALTRLQTSGLKVINPLELAWTFTDQCEFEFLSDSADKRVRRALDLIDECDAMLANLEMSSYATAMEMFYAHRHGKMVTVVGASPFSPWVLSHSQARFGDIERGINYIIEEHPKAAPLSWALQYEAQLSERYEQMPPCGEPDYKFIGGELPVLVVAPHATAYWREGEFQEQDSFTGALASVTNRLSGCHS
ncbi:MAG: nucleoside 2-deoxyribosyltransferase domain-containing protein, partial [Candidatus Obscuribacterales bacterium]|nr:nucleoside 2-deoxyribosyltransferase domain-containing protein [Candidatus Obscuribacterales bacterium]